MISTNQPQRERRRLVGALLCSGLLGTRAFSSETPSTLDPLDPLLRPAPKTQRATSAVMIAAAAAGARIVVAGESGLVLWSDDGTQWHQADVPVSVTLTALHFPTAKKGWAVGHSGVVLATQDGGSTWKLQLDGRRLAAVKTEAADETASDVTPGEGDPLLDVCFLDEREGYAVGAFGLMLHTTDAGVSWSRVAARLPNPDGNHLYAARHIGGALYVVGERGLVAVSSDRGRIFRNLKTPYEGSYFGVAGHSPAEVIVFGLQGKAFSTLDGGTSWRSVAGDTSASWTGATVLDGARVVLVGQQGDIHLQPAAGAMLKPVPGRWPPLSAIATNAAGRLIAVGPRGIHAIDLARGADKRAGT